jgi:hypothetical protein
MSGLNSSTRNAVARASSNRLRLQNVTTRFIPSLLLAGACRKSPRPQFKCLAQLSTLCLDDTQVGTGINQVGVQP